MPPNDMAHIHNVISSAGGASHQKAARQADADGRPAAPAGPAAEGGAFAKDHAQALARAFEARDIHPVLIFGTGGSGKTTFLQSLLAYAQRGEAAGFYPTPGESVFPPGYPGKAARDLNAQNFYDNVVEAFHHRQLAPRSQLPDGPFFLPITAAFPTRPEPVHFAFLDSMGEWYEREGSEEGGYPSGLYRDLRWEIASLLMTREKPISVIFVAPTIGIDNRTREYSHQCIANAMSQYQKTRLAKQRDNVLLLVTKWDAICNPDDPHGKFGDATARDVLDRVKDWAVWSRFQTLDGLRRGARAFAPYSAARVNRDGLMTIGGQYAETFDQFNRTIWNWLYGNATEDSFTERKRPVLYGEVMPRTARRTPIHQLVARFVLHPFGQHGGGRP